MKKINKNILREFRIKYNTRLVVKANEKDSKEYKDFLEMGGKINDLPENVIYKWDEYEGVDKYYHIVKSNMTDDEIKETISYMKLEMLNTIKNCILYFTIASIVGVSAYIIYLFL